ncbi:MULTISPECIES: ATP-dependent zinc protease [unclassified Oceanobacter]|jgi:hypothetical protein|uniref:ATP-dependent zinc protease family protein n=1 Tax=unclassified Oceanobacter TaxID=2620260 RepID=UPI0027334EB4|nr:MULTISPECIES: ATP-dependent zinc protease [unclassified Oceanobacter]MDP2609055.1 ATP-dependent zinc protease [Oceanobacter sp. 1_MG-2023]MDP2612377.1 ATP-dependent zinc protease [Oceanobacter sp. 2_MG-2023]
MAAIEEVVARHNPDIDLSCPELDPVLAGQQEQQAQLKALQRQVRRLTAANPAPVSCPTTGAETTTDTHTDKLVVGATEWIYLTPPGHHYRARVDSGAATSSLSARNITRFERNGQPWVRFLLQHDDESEPWKIEAKLVRNVLIRQASNADLDRRPVVELTVHLGQQLQQKAEFSLADRSQMTYPILLGRSFLQDVTLIDVGKKFLLGKYQPDLQIPVVSEEQ